MENSLSLKNKVLEQISKKRKEKRATETSLYQWYKQQDGFTM